MEWLIIVVEVLTASVSLYLEIVIEILAESGDSGEFARQVLACCNVLAVALFGVSACSLRNVKNQRFWIHVLVTIFAGAVGLLECLNLFDVLKLSWWFEHLPAYIAAILFVTTLIESGRDIKENYPRVKNVGVDGNGSVGCEIVGFGDYTGMEEGKSVFNWFREDQVTGKRTKVFTKNLEANRYTITHEDIGLRLIFSYLPVDSNGFREKLKRQQQR